LIFHLDSNKQHFFFSSHEEAGTELQTHLSPVALAGCPIKQRHLHGKWREGPRLHVRVA